MIRKSRNLLILISALILLSGGFVVVKLKVWEKEEPLPPQEELLKLVDLERSDLRRFRFENPQGELIISSSDGESWSIENTPAGYVTDTSSMNALLNQFSTIDIEDTIEEEELRLSDYGLSPPVATVYFEDAQGETLVLEFGNKSLSGGTRYAKRAEDSTVYMVSAWRGDKALTSMRDLRDKSLPKINKEEITRIKIQSKGRTFEAVPHEGEDPYRTLNASMDIIQPWEGRYPLEDYKFQEQLNAALPPTEAGKFIDSPPQDLSLLGFGPQADRILIESTDREPLDLEIGIRDQQGRRYVRQTKKENVLFLLEEKDLGLLRLDPFDLTNKFAFLGSIDKVKEVRIEGEEIPFVLTIQRFQEEESEAVYHINKREVPEDDFKTLYQSIIGLVYEGAAEKKIRLDQPVYRLHFIHTDDEIPPKTLRLWTYNRDYYLGGVTGEPAEFILGKYQIKKLLEELKALEDYGA